MIIVWILLGLVVLLAVVGVVMYNGLIGLRNLVAGGLAPDRRRAEAPARPHPQPRRDRQGLRRPRARHPRGGHGRPVRGHVRRPDARRRGPGRGRC